MDQFKIILKKKKSYPSAVLSAVIASVPSHWVQLSGVCAILCCLRVSTGCPHFVLCSSVNEISCLSFIMWSHCSCHGAGGGRCLNRNLTPSRSWPGAPGTAFLGPWSRKETTDRRSSNGGWCWEGQGPVTIHTHSQRHSGSTRRGGECGGAWLWDTTTAAVWVSA